ncbi:macrolide transport system ATP-binding/permease protein [Orbus hercynius]|uniref:Pyoverdine export ATP-binding/permease protein PvdT n=1 Tax=Orbus hercynius TaxID=593135 RepID=A0A495REL1_9GAMM|nr:MacB family efflux pump subunit [Orbus hercynius]RKS85750.1 macrolide transport system ATP-binding/permease protein [Orbus hercynius]
MDIIKISQINKCFGSKDNQVYALKDIDLTIEKGDFVAIIGQSGSGKSTLMNILGCLDMASSGSYQINGVETSQMTNNQLAELRSNTFGFIFQRYNLLGNLSALENVALPAIYSGANITERRERAKQLLIDLGLGHKLENKPSELSGGQQQRVSIARALMNGGEIILADEPTGALDSKSGENVMEIIIDLHRKGHTIILVTHDKNIANYASRVIEIKDGTIIADYRQNEEIYTSSAPVKKTTRNLLSLYKFMFFESFKMSIQAILSHKMRSLLTMLGIIIGIASVVTVVALGQGSTQSIMANINSMGTNTIDILPGKNFGDMRSNKIKTLTVGDANFLQQQNYIDSTTPNSSTTGTITFANDSVSAKLNGIGDQYFDVKGIKIESGRIFSAQDVKDSASVVVIDQNVKNKLFANGENPLGKMIIFNKKPFKIIGVAQKLTTVGMSNDTLTLWAPYTTVMNKVTGDKYINSITVKVADNVSSQMAENSIIDTLTQRHGSKDFFTINTDSIKQTIESTASTMTILISGIALISLIVGGIGVMNIMLVSVTERTKEIGLRMAIGAKQADIMQQFLIEAVLICLIGGTFGLIFSGLIGSILQFFLSGSMTLSYSVNVMVLSIIFSMLIGVVFGFMPAKNAAKLNPIEALTRE